MLSPTHTTVFSAGSLREMDGIAARIRQVLDERGWSAAELNRRAGLASPTHVATILRRGGARAGGDTLGKIAQGAGVSERWLLTGEGSPDHDDDSRGPSYSDDATPVLGNVENWADVVKADCLAHPDITPAEITTGSQVARYMLHRPALPGDLWDVVQQMRKMNDPAKLARMVRESEARLRELEARLPEQIRWEQEQLAKKRERR